MVEKGERTARCRIISWAWGHVAEKESVESEAETGRDQQRFS